MIKKSYLIQILCLITMQNSFAASPFDKFIGSYDVLTQSCDNSNADTVDGSLNRIIFDISQDGKAIRFTEIAKNVSRISLLSIIDRTDIVINQNESIELDTHMEELSRDVSTYIYKVYNYKSFIGKKGELIYQGSIEIAKHGAAITYKTSHLWNIPNHTNTTCIYELAKNIK